MSQLYKPAVDGTQNILNSCTKSNKVKVITYTSSVGTMASHHPEAGIYNESSWQNLYKLEDGPYHYSKIQAEKLFLKFIEDNKRFRGVVVNPGAIMGPYVNYELEKLSPYQLEDYYMDYFPFIDVGDLAKSHELAMLNPNAKVCNGENNNDVIYAPNKAKEILGLNFTDWKDTVRDTAEQLIE
ncbi:NAD(P)-binding protein [Conidiobolus coronatus NRRL 28638]|uniref:NAD(P)-binding protein n=1 Tax=Conidiobolus coronatus (strain ATCC 28846 / CBS 209.66 / NRRL 28638) TaxID=796925 RepID=A0A137P0Y4_CONC2|nr:NAD(P)-binding protein [Conidiobolus coronatus NRRL 28638]|eukprot:KXN68662.1 NAD(P)-binding protein [Conidiobolus coronatus NRRL 28638]